MVRQNVREQVFNGKALFQARTKHGLTQEKLAILIGSGASQINRYEKGESEPSLAVILRLKRVLGVSLEELVLETGEDRSNDPQKWAEKQGVSLKVVLPEMIEYMGGIPSVAKFFGVPSETIRELLLTYNMEVKNKIKVVPRGIPQS